MFFGENEISLELLGVFKIKREAFNHRSFTSRSYDSLSIRLSGSGKFETKTKTVSTQKGDILYIPKNADYIQSTLGEDIIAIHFINYSFTKNDEIECMSVEAELRGRFNLYRENRKHYRLYNSRQQNQYRYGLYTHQLPKWRNLRFTAC